MILVWSLWIADTHYLYLFQILQVQLLHYPLQWLPRWVRLLRGENDYLNLWWTTTNGRCRLSLETERQRQRETERQRERQRGREERERKDRQEMNKILKHPDTPCTCLYVTVYSMHCMSMSALSFLAATAWGLTLFCLVACNRRLNWLSASCIPSSRLPLIIESLTPPLPM